jgi:hypothetical protein
LTFDARWLSAQKYQIINELPVKKHHPAIIGDILMHDRHADVDNDVLGCRVIQQVAKHLPAVQKGVALVKMILATVTTKKQRENTSS